jgi:Amidase
MPVPSSTSRQPIRKRYWQVNTRCGILRSNDYMQSLETNNNVWGRTVNPYNRALTPGGSSGGEGALIALKGSPLGLGTDIGGSIVRTALFLDPKYPIHGEAAVTRSTLRAIWIQGLSCSHSTCWPIR